MDPSRPDDSCYLSSRSIKMKFACRFLGALKKINKRRSINNTSSSNTMISSVKEMSRRCKTVRMAADASMASAVGPRKAWSRAMLIKLIRTRRIHGSPTPPAAARVLQDIILRSLPTRRLIKRVPKRKLQGLAQTVRPFVGREYPSQANELRRLVPGGEAMDLYMLLDETAHYIKCLTTQVKSEDDGKEEIMCMYEEGIEVGEEMVYMFSDDGRGANGE